MNRFRSCVVVLLALMTPLSMAVAGGFQLNEVGARAMGMGGAFAAQANDLSALYYNPAGLAYQRGFGAYLGGTMILPSASYTNPAGTSTTDMVSQTFLTPNAYLGYGMENGLSFAVGVNVPFGLGTEWPAGWAGRYKALKADLNAIQVNPTIAYRVNDMLMFGAGVTYTNMTVKISYNVATYSVIAVPPTPAPTDGLVTLDADGSSWSFDVGAIVKPMPALSIGVSYRHTSDTDLEGTATFTNMQALQPFFPGGTGKTNITLPNQIFAGLAYKVSDNLTLEFDYQWVGWSTYDSLIIEIPTGPIAPFPPQLGGPRPLQGTSRAEKAWNNTYLLRLGGEYVANDWRFRLGFIYDATPQPDKTVEPVLPDANRMEGTIGVGYHFAGNWQVDVAYQYISFKERTVTAPTNSFPGTYKNSANLFGLSLGYNL
jgi:long-chain fatty acid transport protein